MKLYFVNIAVLELQIILRARFRGKMLNIAVEKEEFNGCNQLSVASGNREDSKCMARKNIFFFAIHVNNTVDMHLSKALISLDPDNLQLHCF